MSRAKKVIYLGKFQANQFLISELCLVWYMAALCNLHVYFREEFL